MKYRWASKDEDIKATEVAHQPYSLFSTLMSSILLLHLLRQIGAPYTEVSNKYILVATFNLTDTTIMYLSLESKCC